MSEQPPRGPGIAVLIISMPGGAGPPTDTRAAMIAWLYRHGAPRTGELLRRLERHGWTIEPPDPAAATQTVLWASAHFADVEQARAAARPFQGRINDRMRWAPASGPRRWCRWPSRKALTRHGGSDMSSSTTRSAPAA